MTKINIDGVIAPWNQDIRELRRQLAEAKGALLVEINSPGGSVWHGIELFNLFRNYDKGEKVARIGAMGASMASYIPLAFDIVEVYDNTTYMIHNAWMFTYGDHIKLKKDADVLSGLTSMLRRAYVAKTGKSEAWVTGKMDAESYFFGQEIADAGFADKVITTSDAADKASALAVAQTALKEMMAELRTHEMPDENEKVAAYLKTSGLMKQSENKPKPTQEEPMDLSKLTIDALKEQRKDLVASLEKDGYDKGTAEGATHERERITALMALDAAGYEDVISAMIADPEKTVNDAKIAIFDAQQERLTKEREARAKDGATLAQEASKLSGQTDGTEDDEAKAVALMQAAAKQKQGV